MPVKIDLENAYDRIKQDRIEWDLLENVLRHIGFVDHFVRLIMRCKSLASLSIYGMVKNWTVSNLHRGFTKVILSPFTFCALHGGVEPTT